MINNIKSIKMMKHQGRAKKQSGFTLIELVIVVVILGFLAATAIPKFLDLTDQAQQANIEGMAGGFATAVSLVRSQWEAEGRPQTGAFNAVNYDGINLLLTTENIDDGIRPGYVVSATVGPNQGAGLGGSFTAARCVDVWNNILQQPPRITNTLTALDSANGGDDIKYFAVENGGDEESTCHYFLKETLVRDGTGYATPGNTFTLLTNVGNSFTYRPANSSVVVHINN